MAAEAYAQTAYRYEQSFQAAANAGDWRRAIEAKVSASGWAYQNGQRPKSVELLDEAIALATQHGFPTRAMELAIHRMDQNAAGDPSGASLDELKRALPRLVSGMVKLMIAGARRSLALEDQETAGELLDQAALFARALSPLDRMGVELELADFHEARAQQAGQAEVEYGKALEHAEQALRSSRSSGGTETVSMPLMKLAVLRAQFEDASHQRRSDEAIGELERGGWVDQAAIALNSRALLRIQKGQLERALADVERVLATAPAGPQRGLALKTAGLIYKTQNDYPAAMRVTREAIEILDREAGEEGLQSGTPVRERYKEVEGLYQLASWIAAESGDAIEAFHYAENGRALALRHELTLAGAVSCDGPASFEQAHSLMVEESAALLSLSCTRWGTLAVLTDPAHAEPRVFLLELTGGELRALFAPKGGGADEKAWTQALFAAVPALSAKIMPKLEAALLELLPACKTLYIEPESYLFHVPFPALQLSDGSHLIEHIPLAVIPSASVLSAMRTRRPATRRKSCMAYGIGESNDIYFATQAQDVARLSWESCRLFPERTRKADLLAAMREYSVIHFACHGSLAAGISDPLAASLIELFPPEQLTANDVLRNGSVPAELVFLNACQSGRFRMDARSEPDGFWRAFLHAGTSTLVGALTLVDPDAANLLALKFYEEFLGGASKAKAMQSAQCNLIRQSAPVEHWGAHVLVGDAA